MAAGVYDTDLITINLAETNTGWIDVNQAGGGGANSAEIDFAIQGTNAITRQVNNTRRGVLYDTGSTVTLGADEHIFVWTVCATPGIADIKSNGGVRVSIGTSTNNYYDFYVNGSDTLPKGGMRNYAVYYAAASASLQNGSPGANPQFFGAQASTVGTAKGDNFACDAIRRGTGLYITEGDATAPITFESASVVNDSNANRYGILSARGGGYNLKGRFVIGQDPNLNTTQSYFDDANTAVTFLETEFAKDDFTQIIVDHPSTFFNAEGINFTGVSTFNPGQIVFNNSSTTGTFTNCNFNTIGKTFLKSNVVVSGSGWASSDTVFQSGSDLFDSSFRTTVGTSASVLVDDPSLIRQCVFDNEGSKHGIEVIVTGSYVFEANLFSNFDSGSNANEALYFNPPGGTGDLTLQITNGGTNINFRNASSGTVTIENNASITLTGLKDYTEVRVFDTASNAELAGIENTFGGNFTFTLEIGTTVNIVLLNLEYINKRISNFSITQTQDLPVSQRFDRNYDGISGYGNSLFVSLEDRSTFFENESDAKSVFTSIETSTTSTASLLYVAAGYSSGSIQSLVPSSSAGDLFGKSASIISQSLNPRILSRINSEGYIVSSSVVGLPKLNYSSTDIGKSGSFHFSPTFTIGNGYAINFLDNGTLNGPFRDTAIGGVISSSNTLTTYPVSGITDPGGFQSASLIEDDNSGGSKEVWWGYEDVNPNNNTFKYQFSIFAKPSGANYLYLSASFGNSGSEQWFNLANSTTGSSNGANLAGPFLVQDFQNGWKRVGVQYNPYGTNTGNMIVGISDTDGGKTVTADGTAKMYLWGVNSAELDTIGGITGRRLAEFTYGNVEDGGEGVITPIVTTFTSSIIPNITSTDGYSVYFEGSFNISTMTSASMNISNNGVVVELFNDTTGIDDLQRISLSANATTTERYGITVRVGGTSIIGQSLNLNDFPFRNRKFIKIGIRVKDSDCKVFLNGSETFSRLTSFTISNLPNKVQINQASGLAVKSYAVFSQPLSDAELIALTSY